MTRICTLVLTFTIAAGLLGSCGTTQERPRGGRELPGYVPVAITLMSEVNSRIQSEFGVSLVGTKTHMPDLVRELGATFRINRPLSKDEARAMVIKFAQIYLHALNENVELRPYLVHYPMSPSSINILLYCYHPDGRKVCDPYPNGTALSQGELAFYVREPNNDLQYKEITREPYESALEQATRFAILSN